MFNPKLDLASINAYAKFGPISLIPSQVIELSLTIKNLIFYLLSPDLLRKIAPTQIFLLVFLKKIFISCSQIQFFNFFSISLQKCSEYAVVNRGATERGMNWNKCHSLL